MDEIIEEPVATLFHSTAKNLEKFQMESLLEEGAPELKNLIGRGASGTSIGVGYAPLSPTEKLVLDLEEEVRNVRGLEKISGSWQCA